jgi:large subunit ribosomal protein L23
MVRHPENASHVPRTRGPKLEPYQIVLRPIITEKGTHQSTHRHAYPFEVNPWATKDEIKAAVEDLFGVRVSKVRTQNRPGKRRRFRFRMGKLTNWKKAIVTLHPDSPAIEFF